MGVEEGRALTYLITLQLPDYQAPTYLITLELLHYQTPPASVSVMGVIGARPMCAGFARKIGSCMLRILGCCALEFEFAPPLSSPPPTTPAAQCESH